MRCNKPKFMYLKCLAATALKIQMYVCLYITLATTVSKMYFKVFFTKHFYMLYIRVTAPKSSRLVPINMLGIETRTYALIKHCCSEAAIALIVVTVYNSCCELNKIINKYKWDIPWNKSISGEKIRINLRFFSKTSYS